MFFCSLKKTVPVSGGFESLTLYMYRLLFVVVIPLFLYSIKSLMFVFPSRFDLGEQHLFTVPSVHSFAIVFSFLENASLSHESHSYLLLVCFYPWTSVYLYFSCSLLLPFSPLWSHSSGVLPSLKGIKCFS